MFERLGRAMYHARWAVLAVWLLVLALSAPFAPQVSHVLKGGGFANGTSESDRATNRLVSDLGVPPSSLTVIFTSPTLRATDPRFRQAMRAALAPAAHLQDVSRIDTYYNHLPSVLDQRMISNDGHSALAILDYTVSFDLVQGLVPTVRATIHSPLLRVLVAGDGAVFGDMQTVSGSDLAKVERYTFPIALILLVTIFGTLVASAVPIITGAVSVAATLAVLYFIGQHVDTSVFALNVTTMIGLGVGIDYALFVVSRFREEVHRRPVEEAVAIAVGSAGRAVLFSGVTVMIGLAGLLIFRSPALRSIGMGGSLVVLISVIAALTLLPALLSVLGPRVDALPIVPWRTNTNSRFWHALATVVMRRPWPVIAGVLVVVATLALPARMLHLNVPDATILPKSVPSRQGFDLLNQQFDQQKDDPVVVVVYGTGTLLTPSHAGAFYDYAHTLSRLPGVRTSAVKSLLSLAPDIPRSRFVSLTSLAGGAIPPAALRMYAARNTTVIVLPPIPGQSEQQLEHLVGRVRAVPLGAGLHRDVGGFNAGVMDYLTNLYSQFPLSIAFVVIVTYLVLLVMLRSVILPLKAVLMNALSLLGAYGAVVWVFQEGHLSGLLNFSPTGYVDEITPIIMFCTLFGLSMDYEVFLLSRMREQFVRTQNNAGSVAYGLERTGRIVTSAALILVVVAGSFAFTDIVLVKAVGLGLAFAILLDATLIRCLLVPATMRVLGDWNWWLPRPLRSLLGSNFPDRDRDSGSRYVA
ncbi:MAG TPA: MMPL family transporter [Chloroflexota bacterium]|nr:MMPL family transporter [Chloroflexota bacterium]